MEPELVLAKKTVKKTKALKSKAVYVVDKDMGIAERIADYMNWLLDSEPFEFVTWTKLTFNVLGLPRMPRSGTDPVRLVQRAASRAYRILEAKYGRLYCSLRGYGIRACVDADDMAKSGIRASVRRGRSSIASIRRQADLIDEREISNTAAMRPYKEFVTKQLKPSLKNLATLEQRLSLPPLVDDEV